MSQKQKKISMEITFYSAFCRIWISVGGVVSEEQQQQRVLRTWIDLDLATLLKMSTNKRIVKCASVISYMLNLIYFILNV